MYLNFIPACNCLHERLAAEQLFQSAINLITGNCIRFSLS